ncbi:hypothetical protein EniLVp02_0155 [Vibrio phage EniLVp02]
MWLTDATPVVPALQDFNSPTATGWGIAAQIYTLLTSFNSKSAHFVTILEIKHNIFSNTVKIQI